MLRINMNVLGLPRGQLKEKVKEGERQHQRGSELILKHKFSQFNIQVNKLDKQFVKYNANKRLQNPTRELSRLHR